MTTLTPLDSSAYPPTVRAVIDAIEAERIRRGIGHTRLSIMAGYSQNHWRDNVRQHSVRVQTLIDIAEALGLTLTMGVKK